MFLKGASRDSHGGCGNARARAGLLEIIVPHCDPAVNEYDQMYGIRKDKVEVVWDITGRGKSQ